MLLLTYLGQALVAFLFIYSINIYRGLARNIAAAERSGLPYVVIPLSPFNRAWLILQPLILPCVDALLPHSWTRTWRRFMNANFSWDLKYDMYRPYDSDILLLVSPGPCIAMVADPDAVAQITSRRADFPKPIWQYTSVDVFGKNVVSVEGSLWRDHRRITSPPFAEKNNVLVWEESLRQTQTMMAGWISNHAADSGPVRNVATEAMRLSLHVISRAGFGTHLHWPHENHDAVIPPGHSMTYKDAIETLLHNLIAVIVLPTWVLKYSPFSFTKIAYEAKLEWGNYMRDMYEEKRKEISRGESGGEGMDLMGALVKGAGLAAGEPPHDHNKPSSAAPPSFNQEDIMGNSFVFILAGHETAANTIHFSLVSLAMHISSQKALHRDIDQIVGTRPSSEWDYEHDMTRLYGGMCGAVMNEELRVFPPVTSIPKVATADRPQTLNVDGKTVTIPAGWYVNLHTAAAHRNPKYWPHTSEQDLNEFRPERWLLDSDPSSTEPEGGGGDAYEKQEDGLDFDGPDQRPDTATSLYRPRKGLYIPFSEGYRSCLGRRFAQVEIMAVLAVIFQSWSVELDVSDYLSDAAFEKATEGEKREAWAKADAHARKLIKENMATIITNQIRDGIIPLRFVKRGRERFRFMWE